jgi:hypothetical protein
MALFLSFMRLSWRVYCIKGGKFGVSKDGIEEKLTESMRDWKGVHYERVDSLMVNRVEVGGKESMLTSSVAVSVRDVEIVVIVFGGREVFENWIRGVS